eukprot:458704-Prorocentrum_minimum.AAC.7
MRLIWARCCYTPRLLGAPSLYDEVIVGAQVRGARGGPPSSLRAGRAAALGLGGGALNFGALHLESTPSEGTPPVVSRGNPAATPSPLLNNFVTPSPNGGGCDSTGPPPPLPPAKPTAVGRCAKPLRSRFTAGEVDSPPSIREPFR